MKIAVPAIVSAALFALSCAAADVTRHAPVKVILDSDMIEDYDDMGAISILHALADAGECEILATVSCTRDNGSVAAIEICNAYYGRPDIPVGCSKLPSSCRVLQKTPRTEVGKIIDELMLRKPKTPWGKR